ncbi:unnamed protein product [Phytophthora fragariaefolia]|uniref:Unnamed protein product n=1 Tax=Phytophthora fragariaefolia TaxID=1490495 RepID=A0A9W7CK40_9STRA|nr:unnamed protein product [Phytophthora fragariaefolia]
MQQDLPASGMPQLTSKLAVVPANPESEERTVEEKFQEVFDQGTEAAERLETELLVVLVVLVAQFRDLVKSRNTDIQEEYARMLKELDDQTESLDQDIAKEKELQKERAKRRQEEELRRKASKKQRLDEENEQLKVQLDDSTSEIRHLQEVFAALEKEEENQDDETSPEDEQTLEERRRLEEERTQNEIVELQQEIVLLKEAQEAIAEKINKQSLKTQYEEEKQEILEEMAHVSALVTCSFDFPSSMRSNCYHCAIAEEPGGRSRTSNHVQWCSIALIAAYSGAFSGHWNADDTAVPAAVQRFASNPFSRHSSHSAKDS